MLETKPNLQLEKILKELLAKFVFATDEEENLKTRALQNALELSIELHKEQTRQKSEPYINHILRVTNRLTVEYGVTDPDVIIAALLHDSVEDQSVGLSKLALLPESRENSLSYIANTFGSRVAFLVENLTNEEVEIKYDENGNEIKQSDEEVIQNYTNHVEEIINKDDDLLLIKLSDFSDNALNLQSVEDVSKRLWLSRKYQPVMEKFVKRISERSSFSVDQKGRILTTLQNAILETEKIISENS